MLVILATQEAKIRKITIWRQPRQTVCETLSQESTSQKRADGMAIGVGSEFKPQYSKKRKKQQGKNCHASDSFNSSLQGSLLNFVAT
jgi:hypothetical protein